jgi:hypothetical protein
MTEEVFDAWTEGESWNGWAVPYFEPATAQHLLNIYRQQNGEDSAWYDSAADEYCFRVNGSIEVERYGSLILKAGDQPWKLYPIGARCWIWDIWEPLN